ncbi:MAG: protein translocase subunit SecF [Treponema sp.]|jgi:preprotein translocase subunit SecF|nr:protein translocase subunit SecF [Treponema sp.]
MQRIIHFSKYFKRTAIISSLIIVFGLAGYGYFALSGEGGFNLGIDFQAGLIQEIQFAPSSFSLTYDGAGNATLEMNRSQIEIIISGASVNELSYPFPFNSYPTIESITQAIESQIEGCSATVIGPADAPSYRIVESTQGSPQLNTTPFVFHYLPVDAAPIGIERVRESLSQLGTVSVQVLGEPADRRFMIRMGDSEVIGKGEEAQINIMNTLEQTFGDGEIAVTSARYVESRFSKELTNQAGILMALTLVIILIYASIRFKPQFAIGAVIAIIHDSLIVIAFIAWSRMEFNTTTIAAILTILGYSINDTIVIFDRIRETRRLYPEDPLSTVLDRSITETLGRTIITTVTTLLAVLSLFIFTTGSMKDFALALIIGMISGVYSTIFIASGFVFFWDARAQKHAKRKLPVEAVPVKA